MTCHSTKKLEVYWLALVTFGTIIIIYPSQHHNHNHDQDDHHHSIIIYPSQHQPKTFGRSENVRLLPSGHNGPEWSQTLPKTCKMTMMTHTMISCTMMAMMTMMTHTNSSSNVSCCTDCSEVHWAELVFGCDAQC